MSIKKKTIEFTREGIVFIIMMFILSFFSWEMFKEQRRDNELTRREGEVSRMVYNLASVLSGSSCRESFAGLNMTTPTGVIRGIKLVGKRTPSVLDIYPVDRAQSISGKSFSLKSYSLNPKGQGHLVRNGVTYLLIDFDLGEGQGHLTREIKLYTKNQGEIIKDCSLFPWEANDSFWKEGVSGLSSDEHFFQINTNSAVSTLNLKGGLLVRPVVEVCDQNNWGSLFWNQEKGYWIFCTQESGSISLGRVEQKMRFNDLKLEVIKE